MSGSRTSRTGRTDDGVREVADGVFLITRAVTNSYLVDTDDGLVLVDAGLPRSWPLLRAALAAFRAAPDDLVSVVLTHGHFDHVGTLDRLQRDHHVPVHVHEADTVLPGHGDAWTGGIDHAVVHARAVGAH